MSVPLMKRFFGLERGVCERRIAGMARVLPFNTLERTPDPDVFTLKHWVAVHGAETLATFEVRTCLHDAMYAFLVSNPLGLASVRGLPAGCVPHVVDVCVMRAPWLGDLAYQVKSTVAVERMRLIREPEKARPRPTGLRGWLSSLAETVA